MQSTLHIIIIIIITIVLTEHSTVDKTVLCICSAGQKKLNRHDTAENWGCLDTVDANGLTPMMRTYEVVNTCVPDFLLSSVESLQKYQTALRDVIVA